MTDKPEPKPKRVLPQVEMRLVEMIADPDECAFDQPCAHGHRVESHSVYCHNREWAEAPRKCRRSWYTGGTIRDEDCPGFRENANKA